ncbi:ribosome assembly RNA-binding protein YhbY [Terribacillus saccharophilus]|uniref:RNA-binding protein n=1 Tax=Terribacillus saccharophilus TaxID=361277 RepID=A0A075LQW8_9BACI|nr:MULTISPECIES: ribosome assembly RNA-binding protein YhbY [Terribacillus]AIF66863.1 RNA-binding protein [Terribacillus goriensis]MCM3224421.1 ribosome assembly RNA-binding protein YhbY [Terribacillus saccharophilus]MEC0283683.1 ribosome assembly RNA-binding protein YhbY [Terribacillus saccharophilus]MEC0290639.1 ribosome assembly RNA-binding protein YhbY [Terribacillus saccharophilus]SEM54455.1 RNA-binding protein [Terribacillus saccharophilus]
MLTGKQKRYLRAQAHHLKPIFQVGKIGVNDNMLVQIGEALEKRELIKVSLLQNCLDEKEDVAAAIEEGIGASIVQIIGSTIILYRESEDNKQIKLP